MRIRQYPINTNLTDSTMLLGTDSNGLTKNHLLGSIKEYVLLAGETITTIVSATTLSADSIYTDIKNADFVGTDVNGKLIGIQAVIPNITVSSAAPSGIPSDGDIWVVIS